MTGNSWSRIPYDTDLFRHCVVTDVMYPNAGIPKLFEIRLFVDPHETQRNAYTLVEQGTFVPVLAYFEEYKGEPFPRKGKGGMALHDRISDYWSDPLCSRLAHLRTTEEFLRIAAFDTSKVGTFEVTTPMQAMYQYLDEQLDKLHDLTQNNMPVYDEDAYYRYRDMINDIDSLWAEERMNLKNFMTFQEALFQRGNKPSNYIDFDFIFG